MADDHQKKKLLNLARQLSPMKTALKFRLLRHTVLPRLLCQYLTWIVLITWGGTAALAYNGITEGDIEDGVFTGAGTMVTFMIIFYVSYCYTRYTQQFDEVQTMMRSIISVCAWARVNFKDPDEANRIYRYLNMLHILCYTGLSPTYSVQNFFLPLAEKHMLFGVVGSKAYEQEQKCLSEMSIDKEGGRAWQMMYLWSLQVVRRRALAGVLTPPIHAQLNKELSLIADCCGNLFACSYQVLPFIYTQLVSFACTIYLVAIAFLKGVHFTQDESLTYGLIIPFINVFLTTFTIFGLLEVGDTIMDPVSRIRSARAPARCPHLPARWHPHRSNGTLANCSATDSLPSTLWHGTATLPPVWQRSGGLRDRPLCRAHSASMQRGDALTRCPTARPRARWGSLRA